MSPPEKTDHDVAHHDAAHEKPDSFDALAHELVRFVRAIKSAHRPPETTEGTALERAAFILLHTLHEHGSLRPSALADVLHVDLSTVSRQMSTLESDGLLERQPDPVDKRAVVLRLTAKGREVLELNIAARRKLMRRLVEDWTEGERVQFTRLMARLNDGFHQHAGDPGSKRSQP